MNIVSFLIGILSDPIYYIIILLVVASVITYRRLKERALGKMQYSRAVDTDGIFVGETLTMTEIVRNPSWFPLFSVKMEFYLPAGLTVDDKECREYSKLTSVFFLPPHATVTRKHTLRADKRGHYTSQTASTFYRDCEYSFEQPLSFYAYPSSIASGDCYDPDVFRAGNAISNRKYVEDPFFLSNIRAYRLGDPMRSINFKASARSFSGGMRRLMCNSYDSSRTHDTMIFLDLNSYAEAPTDAREQLENSLHIAVFLLCEAIKYGGRVGFATNCESGASRYIHIPCGVGESHVRLILETLAELDLYARRDCSMSSLLSQFAFSLPVGTDLYLIAPYADSKTTDILHVLEYHGRSAQLISPTGGAA